MINKLIFICFLVLIIYIFINYSFSQNNENDVIRSDHSSSKVDKINGIDSGINVKSSQTRESFNDAKGEYKSEIIDNFMDEKRFNEILKNGEKNGVTYMSMYMLEPKDKKDVEKAIENLRKIGSLSGGIKLKEFTELDKARDILDQEGLNNILARLDDFKSVPDSIFKEYGMKVTGAQNFGLYHEDRGWSGIYKLYENSNKKVEIEQIHLKPKESSQLLISESLNMVLANETPAVYEYIKSDNIEKITFVSDNQYYQINSKDLGHNQIIDISNKIILNSEK